MWYSRNSKTLFHLFRDTLYSVWVALAYRGDYRSKHPEGLRDLKPSAIFVESISARRHTFQQSNEQYFDAVVNVWRTTQQKTGSLYQPYIIATPWLKSEKFEECDSECQECRLSGGQLSGTSRKY